MIDKVLILCDTHFGVKGGAEYYLKYQEEFFTNLVIPTLKKHRITHIIHLGDFFDSSSKVDMYVLHEVKRFFLDVLEEMDITMDILAGNHDVHHKNNNKVGSLLSIDRYQNINLFYDAEIVRLGNVEVCYIPWMHSNNKEEAIKTIKRAGKAGVPFAFGHLDMQGFMYNKFKPSDKGLDKNEIRIFEPFKLVLSGHYHHPSKKGNIEYPGANFHIDVTDREETRGFYVLDLESGDKEFFEFEHKLYREIVYTEDLDLDTIKDIPMAFIKIIYEGDLEKPAKFNKFLQILGMQNHRELNNYDYMYKKNAAIKAEKGEPDYEKPGSNVLGIFKEYLQVDENDSFKRDYLENLYNSAIKKVVENESS